MSHRPPQPFTHTSKWHGRLKEAVSTHAVLHAVRAYLAALPPAQLLRLPEDCRPIAIRRDKDVDYWTFKLAKQELLSEQRQGDPALLRELLDLFLHASMRISQIQRQGMAPVSGIPRMMANVTTH